MSVGDSMKGTHQFRQRRIAIEMNYSMWKGSLNHSTPGLEQVGMWPGSQTTHTVKSLQSFSPSFWYFPSYCYFLIVLPSLLSSTWVITWLQHYSICPLTGQSVSFGWGKASLELNVKGTCTGTFSWSNPWHFSLKRGIWIIWSAISDLLSFLQMSI